jgi:hypothetical protein
MDMIQVLTVIGVAIANIGTTITLFLWSTNHASAALEENRKETNRILESIQIEMKEFHGRLERQDAEFKAHMLHLHQQK